MRLRAHCHLKLNCIWEFIVSIRDLFGFNLAGWPLQLVMRLAHGGIALILVSIAAHYPLYVDLDVALQHHGFRAQGPEGARS